MCKTRERLAMPEAWYINRLKLNEIYFGVYLFCNLAKEIKILPHETNAPKNNVYAYKTNVPNFIADILKSNILRKENFAMMSTYIAYV